MSSDEHAPTALQQMRLPDVVAYAAGVQAFDVDKAGEPYVGHVLRVWEKDIHVVIRRLHAHWTMIVELPAQGCIPARARARHRMIHARSAFIARFGAQRRTGSTFGSTA